MTMSNPQRGGDYVLVPREPTMKMLADAGMMCGYDPEYPGASPDADHVNWWQAMLAAAPQPPSSPVDSGEAVTDEMVEAAAAAYFLMSGDAVLGGDMRVALEAALTHRLTAKPDR